MKDITETLDLEASQLTAAERMDAFCDSIASYQSACVRREKLVNTVEAMVGWEVPEERLRELQEDCSNRLSEVAARAMTLHGDGTFDRCIDILKIETAGRP